MKTLLIFSFIIILQSCQTVNQQKVFYNENDRIYDLGKDSIWDKLVNELNNSGINIKMKDKGLGIILTENILSEDQAVKYIDFEANGNTPRFHECFENLMITVKLESAGTKVIVKSYPTCLVESLMHKGRSAESIIKQIDCKTTGVREKEILDYLSEN
jgi:hypothetical protein